MASTASAGWRYARSGPISQVLKFEKFDLVTPAKDAAVVKMISAPLHRVDAAVVNGTALGRKRVNMAGFPRVGGCEGVGQVVRAGASTSSSVKEGDLVWVAPIEGTWATHITAPMSRLHKVDKAHQELATTASNFLVAQQLLEGYARLKKGDVVVQNGGSSLTSLAVSALAKKYDVKVLTAATPGERFAAAKTRHGQYGSNVYEYNGAGARQMQKDMGKTGAALYLNGVGGRNFDTFLKLSAPLGQVVTYGAQNSFGLFMSGSNMIYNELTIQGLFSPAYLAELSYAERQTKLDFVLKELSAAKFAYPSVVAPSLEKLPEVWDDVYVRGGRKGMVKIS